MIVEIRRASLDDAEAIAPLLGELGYPSSLEETSRRLAAMATVDGIAVFVASDRTRLTGVAAAQRLVVLHSNANFAQLTLVVVTSAARRQGVGRRLVGAVEDWARQNGCIRILVASGEQRADAHAFYAGLGYAHTARRFSKLLPRAETDARLG